MLDDRRLDRPIYGVQCSRCKHLRHESPYPDGPKCTAFPLGIPAAILRGQVDHTQPVRGDHGVRFEERPDLPHAG